VEASGVLSPVYSRDVSFTAILVIYPKHSYTDLTLPGKENNNWKITFVDDL
jgi:hypothetical protein